MGRHWARRLLIGGLVAVAVAAIALLLAPRPVAVEAGRALVGPIDETVADQGEARVREAYLVSAPVSGQLARIALHVGDRVVAGATLVARIQPANPGLLDARSRAQATAAIRAAEAAIAAARAQHDRLAAEAAQAEGEERRLRPLAASGYASQQALEAAQSRSRIARAGMRAAGAEIEARQAELAAARAVLVSPTASGRQAVDVRSPAAGYVTRVLQTSERSVAAGEPLVEIGDTDGLEAAIDFTTQDAVRIREGMPAEIFDWGGPGALPAVVRRIEPQGFTRVSALGVEEQRVHVLLQFTGDPASWSRLGPGYRVWGRVFLRRERQAVKVPLGALVRDSGGWAVYRIIGGRARLTRVDVGAFSQREAEVQRGLSGGEALIVFPSDQVREGVRVSVRRTPR